MSLVNRARTRLSLGVAVLGLVTVTTLCPPSASAAGSTEPFDFNGDGFADLVVGVPSEDVGAIQDAGAVNVIYGSAKGLMARANQVWSQDSSGIPGTAERGDRFGTAAVSADFNGDGFADLAVGVPEEAIGARSGAGAVVVLYGSRRGLRSSGSRMFSQAAAGVPGTAEAYDLFGGALAAGDFDGDKRADLAIGARSEDLGLENDNNGTVTVLFGGHKGLSTKRAQVWSSERLGFGYGGLFGAALDAGDVTGDGRDDLVAVGSFAMYFLRGGRAGLTADGAQRWTTSNTGLADVMARPGDFDTVVLGNFNADNHLDVAAGSPRANLTNEDNDDCGIDSWCDGAVAVLREILEGSPFRAACCCMGHSQVCRPPRSWAELSRPEILTGMAPTTSASPPVTQTWVGRW